MPTELPSATPHPTLTPTVTPVWFPPTATPIPFQTPVLLQPTADQRPALGAVVVSDDFSSKTGWQVGTLAAGGLAAFGKGDLTLSIQDGNPANLVSLRKGAVPDDFYLEISVRVNLCKGKDSYGLVFRHDGSFSHYRWVLSCDGLLRVERWRPAEVAVVQDWTASGQVMGGAPQQLRLGIWMFRDEMRFFINDVYQFSVRDPLITSSQVGVFARSTGQNAVSVSFSALSVRRITGFVPTPIPSPTIYISPTLTRAPTWTPVP